MSEGPMNACPACGRCECGAVHDPAEHGTPVGLVDLPGTEPVDPNIGTDTLLRIALNDPGRGIGESLADLCAYVERLHALVRWLGRTYAGNEPIWPTENLYGHELPDNKVLAATWRGVMGGGDASREPE